MARMMRLPHHPLTEKISKSVNTLPKHYNLFIPGYIFFAGIAYTITLIILYFNPENNIEIEKYFFVIITTMIAFLTVSIYWYNSWNERLNRTKLSALEIRLPAYQEAYRILYDCKYKLKSNNIEDNIYSVVDVCECFIRNKSLYIDKESRDVFKDFFESARLLSKDPDNKKLRDDINCNIKKAMKKIKNRADIEAPANKNTINKKKVMEFLFDIESNEKMKD